MSVMSKTGLIQVRLPHKGPKTNQSCPTHFTKRQNLHLGKCFYRGNSYIKAGKECNLDGFS